MISTGGVPSAAWTMLAWLGMTWSALEVPQASGGDGRRRDPGIPASRLDRLGGEGGVEWVTAPVAGSMA
jgi:hypothetical protein